MPGRKQRGTRKRGGLGPYKKKTRPKLTKDKRANRKRKRGY